MRRGKDGSEPRRERAEARRSRKSGRSGNRDAGARRGSGDHDGSPSDTHDSDSYDLDTHDSGAHDSGTSDWDDRGGRQKQRARSSTSDEPRRKVRQSAADKEFSQGAARSRGGRRRWKWLISSILLVVAGLLALAPGIAAWDLWRAPLLRALLPEYPGKLEVADLSLSWFSPIVTRGVQVSDAEGQPLFQAAEITTEHTLWNLLWNPADLGTIRVIEPVGHLRVSEDSSNLERALAPLLASPKPSRWQRLTVEVVAGKLHVVRDGGPGLYRLDELRGRVAIDKRESELVEAQLDCRPANIANTATAEGTETTHLEVRWSEPEPRVPRLELVLDNFPLELAEPFLRGNLAGETKGLVSGSIAWQTAARSDGRAPGQAEPEGTSPAWSLELRPLEARGLQVRLPGLMGDDVVSHDLLHLQGQIRWRPDQLAVDHLTIRGDLGRLSGNGQLAWPPAANSPWLQQVTRQPLLLEGTLDLARLGASFPRLLHLRDDLSLEQGELTFHVETVPHAPEPTLQGRVAASDLVATHQQQSITWSSPVRMELVLVRRPEAFVVEKLSCQAEFLQLDGSGTVEAGQLKARGDLTRLQQQLGQFVELPEDCLAGRFEVDGSWQVEEGRLAARGDGRLWEFRWEVPGLQTWTEPELRVHAACAWELDDDRNWQRLASGTATLEAGGDRLQADLTRPVAWQGAETQWPLRIEAGGQLPTWAARLQWLLPETLRDARGDFSLKASGEFGPRELIVETGTLRSQQLALQLAEWTVDEPGLEIDLAGSWHADGRELQLRPTTVRSATLAFRVNRLRANLASSPPIVDAELSVRGDLARLQRMHPAWRDGGGLSYAGQVKGQMQVDHQLPRSFAAWSLEFVDLVCRRRESPGVERTLFQNASVQCQGQGTWQSEDDTVTVDELRLTMADQAVDLQVRGTVHKLRSRAEVDLQGTLGYDLAAWLPALQNLLGPYVDVRGKHTSPFAVHGPLPGETEAATDVIPRWTGQGGLAWDAVQAYGVPVGPGQLDGRLAEGLLDIEPLEVDVSGGRIRLAPTLDLRTSPAELILPAGRLAERVVITPEMCQTWMKFVAPLLAEATRAEGRFSLDLQPTRIPWGNWDKGSSRGSLTIHGGRIGPGPLAQQVLFVADQASTLLLRKPLQLTASNTSLDLLEQTVYFALQDGAVEHRDMTVRVGDVTVKTRGKVGLDQTLNLIAEIPVEDKWIATTPTLAGLRGRSVEVPIRGTFSRPSVDSDALSRLATQLLEGSAERLLEQGLRRLFGGQDN